MTIGFSPGGRLRTGGSRKGDKEGGCRGENLRGKPFHADAFDGGRSGHEIFMRGQAGRPPFSLLSLNPMPSGWSTSGMYTASSGGPRRSVGFLKGGWP